tara:strand:- start:3581 stop:4552 length:972 start_codon:yes stop_codon:yes gene_type:complete
MNWYTIENKSKSADIYIYGEIGFEVNAKEFINELNAVGNKPINIHINSVGGSVFEGQAIYTTIQNYKGKVTAYIEGVAASMASIIALAADEVRMSENSLYMIHNPLVGVYGNEDDLQKNLALLGTIKEQMVAVYEKKTGLPAKQIEALMSAETWFTAEEAKAAGFIDVVDAAVKVAATYDLGQYKNMTQEQMLETLKSNINSSKMDELKTWFDAKIEEVVARFQKNEEATTEKEVVVMLADESDVKAKLESLATEKSDLQASVTDFKGQVETLTAQLEEANNELAKYKATPTKVVNEVEPTPAPADKVENPWATLENELSIKL